MNKLELIDKVASKAEITKAEAGRLVNATLESITEGLAADGKVVLIGFGTFEVRTRTARVGRNPRTGEQLKIAASRVPAFKPGKAMKDAIPQKKAAKSKKK
ncbi:MAG: HU family DNA-binding protein [Clostridia bacterium]|nr:HU family DNA-binding protein [Clostridia bacterium]MBR4458530.1 HU family DNA-binding protein [Clostridia bacterium]